MAIQVKVAIRDKVGKNFRIAETKRIEGLSEKDLERVARECERIIRDMIMTKSRKPTGHLASFFYAHKIFKGWAVGDINELDAEASYWNHLDKGSESIGADRDHWLPKGRWADGRWVNDDSGYWIKHTGPIPAMNYIVETLVQMDLIIPKILKENK